MVIKNDLIDWKDGMPGGGWSTPEPTKKYKEYYRASFSDSNLIKFRNWQAIDYLDLPLNLKEVNIDLDYSKLTPDYLKYKLNLAVPNGLHSIYDFLFNGKNVINEKGKVYDLKKKKKIILDPRQFELNKTYDANFLNNYVKEKYGEKWYIASKLQVLKCEVPMDIPYARNDTFIATNYYVNVNEKVPAKHQKWIQYSKQGNWQPVNEVFDYKFTATVKELWYHTGNAQVVFGWLYFLSNPSLPAMALAHYYHTVVLNTIEFWIQEDETTNFDDYPYSTKLLFQNNFILTPSTWTDFVKAIGDVEPFNFEIKPNEKLIIKGLFIPRIIVINEKGFLLPNIKNLTQLHIKHIE